MEDAAATVVGTPGADVSARSPRRRWIALGVSLTLLVAVVGVLVALPRSTMDDLIQEATVRASSSKPGFSPQEAVYGGPNGAWRSEGEVVGSWIELEWDSAQDLRHVTIERGPLDDPGPLGGFLSFSDGSRLGVTLSFVSRTTVVPIGRRDARSVRFTVSAVSESADQVELTSFVVDDEPRPGDVESGGAEQDGNVAPLASRSSSDASSRADLEALVDGSSSDPGEVWLSGDTEDSWLQLTWDRPRELTTVAVAGAPSTAQLLSATLRFSDGSEVPVGGVLDDPSLPTVVSFMPRTATSVRLTFETLSGSGELALAELSAYQRSAPPLTAVGEPTSATDQAPAASCEAPSSRPDDAIGLVVLCPTTGTVVEGDLTVTVALGPSYTVATGRAWPSVSGLPLQPNTRSNPGADGIASLVLDLAGVPRGPLTVNLTASGPGLEPVQVYLQVQLGSGPEPDADAKSAAGGRSLVYTEEFDEPISISRESDATYLAGKPEPTYVADFADAIFSDPADGLSNLQVVDGGYLRIAAQPRPASYVDPQGYGREFIGGMIASARPGGSGFAAQYGYFEARMLLPASPGTWPAFWMLPTPNLVAPEPVVAEIDALEHYGLDPTSTCHVTHEFRNGKDDSVDQCGTRWASARAALAWHTFAVDIAPTGVTFYIDGEEVAQADQVDGGDEPMFFLLNLALGGGFPIDLSSTRGRADLYVDYIRVYV